MSRIEQIEYLRFQPDSRNASGFISFLHSYLPNDLHIFASSSESCFPPTNIFQNGSFWKSTDVANSSFSISFSKILFRLDSFSSLSCKVNECFKDLDIYGSINNDNPELICSFRGEYKLFYQKNTRIDCPSKKLYNNFTFVNPSRNSINENKFSIYEIEIFGSICSFSTIYSCAIKSIDFILTYFMYIILFS